MIFEQSEELAGAESLCFVRDRDGIPDRSRLGVLPVASSPQQYAGNLMAFDDGTSDFRREPDGDDRDADMSGRDYAWSMGRSDGSMDPWHGDPSSRVVVVVHRSHSVDNHQMDASEESQADWPKEAPLRHCHPVLYHHPRRRVADDCHWHLPLLECSC